MTPTELDPYSPLPYWYIERGEVRAVRYQCVLKGRADGAQPGYIFTLDTIKPIILWELDLRYVFHTQEEAYGGLAIYYQDKLNDAKRKLNLPIH